MNIKNNDIPEGFKITELGPLPGEWAIVNIGEVASVDWGNTSLTKSIYKPIGFAAYSAAGRDGYLDFYEHEGQAVILSAIGARCGKCFFAQGRWTAIKNTIIIQTRNENRLDIEFLYYFVNDERFWNKSGTGQPFIATGKAQLQRIPLPPLPEQKAIAKVLSTIQKTIEAQDKIIAAARELRKSLMRHLFTYGPVPMAEAEKVPLKETEIGMVPEEWELVKLGNLTLEEIRNGAFVWRNRFGNGVPFLNVADTYAHISIDFRSSERVQATQHEMELYKIKPDDLFYVRSSLKREGVGQCCIVENILEPSIYDCHLMRVRVDTNNVLPRYLAYFSVSSLGKQSLISRSKTTTMTTINQQGLASFIFPLPPYNIQQEIVKILASLDTKIATDENRKAALQALFKTMLHQLMTGKVRVKDSEVTAA